MNTITIKNILLVLGGLIVIPALLFIPIPKIDKKASSDIEMPDDFMWGAATSAHQIEGGDVESDWHVFERVEGNIVNGDTAEVAADGYARAMDDVKLLTDLGLNSYRFSVEWARVEPENGNYNEEALKHYKDLVLELKKNGIEPIVTLHHFTNPTWIYDDGRSWVDEEIKNEFIEYSKRVIDYMDGEVTYWTTVNEPALVSRHSYKQAGWPPQLESTELYENALNNMLNAHNQLYDYIKGKKSDSQVGLAYNFTDYIPKKNNAIDTFLTYQHRKTTTWQWVDKVKDKSDFIGVNYYMRHHVGLGEPIAHGGYLFEDLNDMGWNIQPEGLENVLVLINKRYGLPAIITENGLADGKDAKRTRFIDEHVKAIKRAMNQGADVKGYTHWSLMDNFEWQAGYDMKFGLYEINRETLERKARNSAMFYKELVESK